MIAIAYLIAGCSALALLAAGYLLGIRKGVRSRAQVEQTLRQRDAVIRDLRDQLRVAQQAAQQAASDEARLLRRELERVAAAVRDGAAEQHSLQRQVQSELQRLGAGNGSKDEAVRGLNESVAVLLRRQEQSEGAQRLIQRLLDPLAKRERVADALRGVDFSNGTRHALPAILSAIATRGGFGAVILSDDSGLPLAVSGTSSQVRGASVVPSLVMMLADRMSSDQASPPASILIHDEQGRTALHRIFRVRGQRFLLSALATAEPLPAVALDPVVDRLQSMLLH